MVYDTKAIKAYDFGWVLTRFRLLHEEGWEIVPKENPDGTISPMKPVDGVIYLRRPL